MISKDNVEEAVKKKLSFTASTELHDRMLNDVLNAQENSKKTKSAEAGSRIGRIIMKSSITKLAAAAVIIIAITLSLNLWEKSIPLAAADILANATAATNNLHSIHINARMRTLPRDNFAFWR